MSVTIDERVRVRVRELDATAEEHGANVLGPGPWAPVPRRLRLAFRYG